MIFKKITLGAVAAIVFAGNASAKELRFDKLHIGIQGGYGISGADLDYGYKPGGSVSIDLNTNAFDFDDEKFIAGVRFGYNRYITNNILLGFEMDALKLAFRNTSTEGLTAITPNNSNPMVARSEIEVDWGASLRASLGYQWGRTLWRLNGGVAFANVELKASTTDPNPVPGPQELVELGGGRNADEIRIGWVVGAGLDYLIPKHILGQNLALTIDYSYWDFAGSEINGGALSLEDDDLQFSTLMVGLKYRF